MARQEPALIVITADDAVVDLEEIWHWNARTYSVDHAARYIAFLKAAIRELSVSHARGRTIVAVKTCRYQLIRRTNKGYGHILVYRVDDAIVRVLRVFHSAQDWQAQLLSDESH